MLCLKGHRNISIENFASNVAEVYPLLPRCFCGLSNNRNSVAEGLQKPFRSVHFRLVLGWAADQAQRRQYAVYYLAISAHLTESTATAQIASWEWNIVSCSDLLFWHFCFWEQTFNKPSENVNEPWLFFISCCQFENKIFKLMICYISYVHQKSPYILKHNRLLLLNECWYQKQIG